MSNALVQSGKITISKAFGTKSFQDAIHTSLNNAGREKRFSASVISACSVNPALQECVPSSILSAALLGESLNLSPSPQLGQYYMVPYKEAERDDYGKKTGRYLTKAQFQLGYKGYIQLALRSGYYKKLNVISIKEGELIHWDPMMEDIEAKLIQDDDARESAPTIGYYCMFEYLNGFRKAMYWSKKKMLIHADRYSKAFHADAIQDEKPAKCRVSFADFEAGNYPKGDEWKYSSFWYKDFDGMAYKTMLRQLISKWGIMSVDLQTAFEKDTEIVAEQDEEGNVTVNAPGEEEKIPFPDAEDLHESDSGENPPEEGGEVSLNDL